MYRLMVSPVRDTENHGISCCSQEFFLEDAQTVCDVIKRLNGVNCLFTLCEIRFSTVTQVAEKIKK